MLIEPAKPRRGILETLWKTLGPEGTTDKASDWVMKGDDPVAQNVRSLTGVDFLQAVGKRLAGGEALSPYEFPPVGGGRLHYPAGKLPGRDLPVAEPTSAARIVEQQPRVGSEILYHGTAAKPFEDFDLRPNKGEGLGGVLGRGAYFTNNPGYANVFVRNQRNKATDAPHIRMARVREGNAYDMDAPEAVMKTQIEKVARAFADRAVTKERDPGKWGNHYLHARKTMEEETPGLSAMGPGKSTNLRVLAADQRRLDLEARDARRAEPVRPNRLPLWAMTDLRMRHLLRHAGYSSIKSGNDFSGGYQVNVLSPKLQVEHPFKPASPGIGPKFAAEKERRAARIAPPVQPKTINAFDEGRAWLQDNQWADMDPDDFERLSDPQIQRAINRYFDGGWDEFTKDFARTEAPQVPTLSADQLMQLRMRQRRSGR